MAAHGRQVRRVTALAAVVALLSAVAGCRLHVAFTVREDPDGPVTFRLLSGDGRYVVVEARAAGLTVPGPGWWRVDREDGSVDALTGAATRISADGSRVLFVGGALWDEGAVTPGPGTYSDDLTHRVLLVGGKVHVREVATGATTDVEAGHPRPAGTTGASPLGVSGDGQAAWYRLTGAGGAIDRFVRRGDPVPLDLPAATTGGLHPVAHHVAAGGTALARVARHHETVVDPQHGITYEVLVGAAVELLSIPGGEVLASWAATYGPTRVEWVDLGPVVVAEDGSRVWINEATVRADGDLCGWGTPSIPISCTAANLLTALSPGGVRETSLGAGTLVGFDTTPDGLLAVTDRAFPFPYSYGSFAPQIVHAVHGAWETLDHGPRTTTDHYETCIGLTGEPPPCPLRVVGSDAQISDDGTVVASRAMTGDGWYDHVDPPDPPA